MTLDEERWAEALAVDARYGKNGPVFVAERIGALAMRGDLAGIARWKAIARHLDMMRQTPSRPS